MRKTFRFLLIVSIGLSSCKNQESTSDSRDIVSVKQEFDSLLAFIKKYDDPSQRFRVPSNKETKVRGKSGTIIHIDPSNLIAEDGQPLGTTIEVELKELTNQEELLKANAQTTSDGQLLMSGGAYYINMTSEGRQLKLKEGGGFNVEFPKLTENEMSLFYGQRDSLGQIDWKEAAQKFESVTMNESDSTLMYSETDLDISLDSTRAPLTKEEKNRIKEQRKNYALTNEVYKAIEIKQFGWINCDRFYDIPNKTELHLTFNPADSIVSAYAYLVFEDINSVVQYSYFALGSEIFNPGFRGVPVGAKTKLIVFSLKDRKIFFYKSDLTIDTDKEVLLTMSELPQDKVTSLFNF